MYAGSLPTISSPGGWPATLIADVHQVQVQSLAGSWRDIAKALSDRVPAEERLFSTQLFGDIGSIYEWDSWVCEVGPAVASSVVSTICKEGNDAKPKPTTAGYESPEGIIMIRRNG